MRHVRISSGRSGGRASGKGTFTQDRKRKKNKKGYHGKERSQRRLRPDLDRHWGPGGSRGQGQGFERRTMIPFQILPVWEVLAGGRNQKRDVGKGGSRSNSCVVL